jgi:hypothetical protein
MLGNLGIMEQRRPPEYIIEVFADPSSVKDVVRGTVPPTPRRKREGRVELMCWWDNRDFTYDFLPPILPFDTAQDERYTGFDATFC